MSGGIVRGRMWGRIRSGLMEWGRGDEGDCDGPGREGKVLEE